MTRKRPIQLTERERDVMALAIEGLSNKEIGRRLDISHRTVEIHRARLLEKMGAKTLLDLVCIANARLKMEADELVALYDHAPCACHSIGPDGTYIRINDTELEWLGYERDAVIGKKKPSDFYTPVGKEDFQQRFPEFVRDGHVEGREYDLICKGGVIKRVILSANAIKDSGGNFLTSHAVMHDITDLNVEQETLRRLTLEQQAILDSELVGVAKVQDRHIVWRNKSMDHLFGYELGELDKAPTRVLYPDDVSYQTTEDSADRALNAHGAYRTQLEMVRKDGERIWVDMSCRQMPGNCAETLWTLIDCTEHKKEQESVEWLAYHDELTGLPNRSLLADRFHQVVPQTERSKRLLAICCLALDGFKLINDRLGHEVGDTLLMEVARRLQASIRANDTACRLGGDQFVLLLTDLENVEEYERVLKRVIDEIAKPIELDDAGGTHITASIGVTLYPFDGDTPEMLLHHADQAMHQAKQLGRNRVCLFSDSRPGQATLRDQSE
jgi:diguanylate cyclase (GGDEF)-like protein/PAS domain S-box-containing protein